MSLKDDDQIGHVPQITPTHDEIASYQRTKAKGSLASRIGEVPDVQGGSSASGVSTPVLIVLTLVLVATAALSVYLYQKLTVAEQALEFYEVRIGDLERRLSVTDESMSESSVAMKVKVRELDSEIRKLWDNVWKKTKTTLAEHDALLKKQQGNIANNEKFISSAKQQIASNESVVASLKAQLAKAEKMQLSVKANQQGLSSMDARLESSVDKLNILTSNQKKLELRVKGNEEWVESINGFRKQVNRDINSLKQQLGQSRVSGQ